MASERINPILKVILEGVNDKGSSLHKLRGVPEIVDKIWDYITEYWKSYIEITDIPILSYKKIKHGSIYHYCTDPEYWHVDFPEPTGININMMPFVIEKDFKKSGLPDNLKEYHANLIKKCPCTARYADGNQLGKIGYLTIQESFVDENQSQRRPGLHIESPGLALVGHGDGETEDFVHWGCGEGEILRLYGGIYMASTVENSCEVWNCQVLHVEDGPQVTGELGDCEHLREFLPESEIMENNVIYWLTDSTPHESLPLKKGTYRQFFRLVTSNVTLWYEDHSTKNPLGIVPDPEITKIVIGSKFDKENPVRVEMKFLEEGKN